MAPTLERDTYTILNEKENAWNQQNSFTIMLKHKIVPAQCTILAANCFYCLWVFDMEKTLQSATNLHFDVSAELPEFSTDAVVTGMLFFLAVIDPVSH